MTTGCKRRLKATSAIARKRSVERNLDRRVGPHMPLHRQVVAGVPVELVVNDGTNTSHAETIGGDALQTIKRQERTQQTANTKANSSDGRTFQALAEK